MASVGIEDAVNTPGPVQMIEPGDLRVNPQARISRLIGNQAIVYAEINGIDQLEVEPRIDPSGVVDLETARKLARVSQQSVWLDLPEPAEDEDDDRPIQEETRQIMSWARHAGNPIALQVRGPVEILSPVKLKLTHERDVEGDIISIEPDEE